MDDLLARPLLVVTGKGGVGKSTVAAALGVAAARRGLRTIVAEVAARDDVSRTLAGSGARVYEERAVGNGLHHISIEPEGALEEYLRDQLPARALADLLASSRMFTLLAAATPGLRELLTIGKVWELAQPDRRTPGARPYDLVILDAPATGHGVAILRAPRTFAAIARVGPIARQGARIDAMLSDPSATAVVAVSTAEEMPVNETIALRDSLRSEMGLDVSRVVVNGVLARRFSAGEEERVAELPDSPARRAALAQAAQSRAQRGQLGRLRRALRGVPSSTLPYLFEPELGTGEIERLADALERGGGKRR